jgi:hypothetical protein
MNKTIAAATVAASLAVGALTGSVLGAPGLAGAAETATGAVGWVKEALTGLVDDGTISQEQADAVETALDEARPDRGRGHRGLGRHASLSTVAETLGVTQEELRAAMADGKTIAEVATEEDVDVQRVVDAIVDTHRARLDERVAAGNLAQEQADEMLAGAEERATAFVNGERPAFGSGHGGHGGPGGHRFGHGAGGSGMQGADA